MKKNFIIGLLVVITTGGGFYGCQEIDSTDDFVSDIIEVDSARTINICSFNIQWLGHFKKRDNHALADMLKNYDIVVVQEMVSPPVDGTFPDNTSYMLPESKCYTADVESMAFVGLMVDNGFEFKLSDEDTGPGDEIHNNSSATEWFITFYKDETVDYVENSFVP